MLQIQIGRARDRASGFVQWCVIARKLRQFIFYFVVVGLLVNEDVARQLQASGLIEASCADIDLVVSAISKQCRAALFAKPPPCEA